MKKRKSPYLIVLHRLIMPMFLLFFFSGGLFATAHNNASNPSKKIYSILESTKNFDFIVKGINAAALAISTAGNIKKIDQTQFESAGSSSSVAAPPPTPVFSAPQQASIPNIGSSIVSPEGRIGQRVTGAATEQGKRPLQTYVVGSQVSSQQQLDRRISLSARMGG